MADLFYIVEIISSNIEFTHQLIIIPSNWISYVKDSFVLSYPEFSPTAENKKLIETWVENRCAPHKDWKKWSTIDIKKSAPTYHEAKMLLTALTNGRPDMTQEEHIQTLFDLDAAVSISNTEINRSNQPPETYQSTILIDNVNTSCK